MATRGTKTRVAALPLLRTPAGTIAPMMNSGKSALLLIPFIKGIKCCYVFRYHPSTCCLPHGGPPSPPSPPTGSGCPPSGWYWGASQGCCVPYHPNPPPPNCPQGYEWNAAAYKCSPISTPPSTPSPKPSHRYRDNGSGSKKRSQKFRAT